MLAVKSNQPFSAVYQGDTQCEDCKAWNSLLIYQGCEVCSECGRRYNAVIVDAAFAMGTSASEAYENKTHWSTRRIQESMVEDACGSRDSNHYLAFVKGATMLENLKEYLVARNEIVNHSALILTEARNHWFHHCLGVIQQSQQQQSTVRQIQVRIEAAAVLCSFASLHQQPVDLALVAQYVHANIEVQQNLDAFTQCFRRRFTDMMRNFMRQARGQKPKPRYKRSSKKRKRQRKPVSTRAPTQTAVPAPPTMVLAPELKRALVQSYQPRVDIDTHIDAVKSRTLSTVESLVYHKALPAHRRTKDVARLKSLVLTDLWPRYEKVIRAHEKHMHVPYLVNRAHVVAALLARYAFKQYTSELDTTTDSFVKRRKRRRKTHQSAAPTTSLRSQYVVLREDLEAIDERNTTSLLNQVMTRISALGLNLRCQATSHP